MGVDNERETGGWKPCLPVECPPQEEFEIRAFERFPDGARNAVRASGGFCAPIAPMYDFRSLEGCGVDYDEVDVDDAETVGVDSGIMTDRKLRKAMGLRTSWGLADAPLWAKIIGYTLISLVAILGGLVLGMLILFVVAIIQSLLDFVLR